jgi:multisubunit Na+/H+ antiporter MnhE subunit
MDARPPAEREPDHAIRTAATWAAWWAALAVVWLLLVDTFQADELVVGAVAAAIAATVGTVVQRRGYIRFWPRAAWVLETPYLIGGIVVDCGLLARALWRRLVLRRPVHGETIRVPFHHGGDTGRDGARRALVNFAVSITPNSYVVDMDPEGDNLLVHRLVPVPLDRVLRREQLRARTTFPTSDQGGNP